MTYAKNQLIQASDYNNLIGTSPGSTANVFNTIWATGSGTAGYGQTPLANVALNETIGNVAWANLINRAANAATHQGTNITTIAPPAADATIAYLTPLTTNLEALYSRRFFASVQGTTSANTVTNTTSTWVDKLVITHTVSFANGDAARYFFNSGGQLAITCTHSNTATAINSLFNGLASNIGTVVISAMNTGSAQIAGTNYNGVTKVGGGGNSPSIQQNAGYYNQSTANATVFSQNVSGTFYSSSFISVVTRTNGTQGTNLDAGSTYYLATVWDEVYAPGSGVGLTVGTGSTVTCTIRFPETTNIANTWGAVTVSGVVTSVS